MILALFSIKINKFRTFTLIFLHMCEKSSTFAPKFGSMDHDTWQWQKPGMAWRGVGLYHITLTVPDRQPLLGKLNIPDNDPAKAYLDRTPFGNALIDAMFHTQSYHREIQILHFALMPNHLHAIWYVRHTMQKGIASVAQSFLRAAKKLGRAYSYGDLAASKTLFATIGKDAYYALPPIFTKMPHIQPMGHNSQLPATITYLDMNPQRLATMIVKPGFFRVQPNIEINDRVYTGVGNTRLLHLVRREPVHVRHKMTEQARLGNNQPLRDYMNGCVLAARQGAVMVSPFISSCEKDVLAVLLKEKRNIIYISKNGFRDYYKPSDLLFDAVAEGRLLILSPWEYDPNKKHVTRPDCIAMNTMAEEICAAKEPLSAIPEA